MQVRELKLMSGWGGLVAWFVLLAVTITTVFAAAIQEEPLLAVLFVVLVIVSLIVPFGFKVNSPNNAKVVQLFGAYVGTLSDVGFFWGNPFYWPTTVSLRVRTFETGVDTTEEVKDAAGKVTVPATKSRHPLKVNDKDGTPIEIAAVVVWRVTNPTDAVFEVDAFEEFVKMQSDAALRSLASRYSYDAPEDDAHSLRGHIDEVAAQLRIELQGRMHQAGVEIRDARISTLAYAPEIAAAMLQRQQAGAIIAARARIVEGAVGMVEHALDLLKQKDILDLDPERKAAMVCNLLVVLCGHSTPQPVLNTGTLHH